MLCVVFAISQSVVAMEPTLRDVEYGHVGERSLTLDIYQPQRSPDANVPLVVWIHGGAWRAGSKKDVPVTRWLDAGFAIASVDYRLSPEAPFPAQVHDIKAAIRFLRANAKQYGFDARRFVIAGSSAGGHLAALTGEAPGGHSLLLGGQCCTRWLGQLRIGKLLVSLFGLSTTQKIRLDTPERIGNFVASSNTRSEMRCSRIKEFLRVSWWFGLPLVGQQLTSSAAKMKATSLDARTPTVNCLWTSSHAVEELAEALYQFTPYVRCKCNSLQ